MITRWGSDVPQLTQGEWLQYVSDCFTYVVGWSFASPEGKRDPDHVDRVPDPDMVKLIDPAEILSLGRERLLEQDVDMDRAFIMDDEEYDWQDESDVVPQDRYDQVEKLMDLAIIWGSHQEGWHHEPIAMPLPGDTRQSVRDKLDAYAEEHGISAQIDAYYKGVPVADIIADDPDPSRVYYGSYGNWTVSYPMAG